ncbi:MAG: arylsulfatase A-like enzyme [Saprospiraceae bacterium]|jgi:arylsulfatase A-like enzyme
MNIDNKYYYLTLVMSHIYERGRDVFLRKRLILFLGITLFYGCNQSIVSKKDIEKPNVLFVVFDDLNDWEQLLGGHPQAITPNIDRLAKRGVLFSNAHAAGTMCCPSRASVITGLRPSTTGVYKNSDAPLYLYKKKQTLNKHFKEEGYYVAGAGKILHKFYYEEEDWHETFGRRREEGIVYHRDNPESQNITKLENSSLSWGPFSTPDSLTFDARSVEWISDRLEDTRDQPFFLACGIFRPHIPWFNPQQYFDKYPIDQIQLPMVKENDLTGVSLQGRHIAYSTSNFTKPDDLHNTIENAEHESFVKNEMWDDAVQAYLASVTYADAQFGKLLDALDKSAHADNTIIILWSDHGWHLGEKEHWRKATLWEQVTRVPLIVSGPNVKGGTSCTQAVSLLDIYPTLIEMCNLESVDGLEGESLVPQLMNPKNIRDIPAISSLGPDYHAVRDERYRYISYGDGQEELYDHNVDPEEWNNIAGDNDYAGVIERLKVHVPINCAIPVQGSYTK